MIGKRNIMILAATMLLCGIVRGEPLQSRCQECRQRDAEIFELTSRIIYHQNETFRTAAARYSITEMKRKAVDEYEVAKDRYIELQQVSIIYRSPAWYVEVNALNDEMSWLRWFHGVCDAELENLDNEPARSQAAIEDLRTEIRMIQADTAFCENCPIPRP